jgi:hypothetical protein
MSFARNPLAIVLINLVIFLIIELLSLPSFEIMTPARVLTHIGLVVNIILLVMIVSYQPKPNP